MKKQYLLSLPLFGIISILLPFSNGNSSQSGVISDIKVPLATAEDIEDTVTLRIINMEDYIYIQEKDDEPADLTEQFAAWCQENTRFKNVEVIYDTTDTNETLLTQLQLGSAKYDLICPSDYMIQKMIASDLLTPLNRPDRDELLGDYDEYASSYIRNRLDSIEVELPSGTVTVGEYAVGYMWGTLGLLFNDSFTPKYEESILEDMDSWSVMYDYNYNGTISIKDSMRDTYAAVLMKVYSEELLSYRADYLDEEKPECDAIWYNGKIQEVFNRHDEETLKLIKESLDQLKGNIFGLEVDSGKTDIVQGKIGMNLAWSGDAVYSIECGEDENVTLYYSIPLEGSNIWFDAWVMPKRDDRTSEEEELAYLFLDFISMPENAAQNMDYTGYTSFIGGEDILELVRDWYDDRKNEHEEFDPTVDTTDMQMVDLNYFFNNDYGSPTYVPDPEYYFYAEEYYIYLDEEDLSSSVGGMFFTQYPDEETITRCAVMKDFGKGNDAIISLWEEFKSNALPLWGIILLVVEVAGIATLITYYFLSKSIKKKLRTRRK